MPEQSIETHVEMLSARAGGKPWGTVILQDGVVVGEAYGDGGSDGTKWEIGSIRKSVCSTLLGAAIAQGRVSLDTPVHEIWPDILVLGSEKDRGILVRHLATNTSGWMLDHGPDEQWVYNNAACTAGNVVVGRVFEMADDRIAPLVEERIAGPLGLDWDCYHYEEPFRPGHAGSPGPKLAIDSTLRDLVSFGELWLNEGILDGISVSSDYVKQARTNQCAHLEGHYGFWWFTNDGRSLIADAPGDAFYHIGHGREHRRTLFIVVPSLSLVVAIGTHEGVFDIADREKAGPVIAPLFVS